jgi:shikimate dehydrogenase
MRAAAESVYTFADLESWSAPGVALAVVGHPVAHSLSPVIHHAALAELARTQPVFGDWRYYKFDVAPEYLSRALPLFHRRGFHGLNLTVPHKALAVELLVQSDPFVQVAGAANTLTRTHTGWHGCNTDGPGLTAALHQELAVELAGADVILLGAGGAARAAAFECLRAGCASLAVANRTASTLERLIASLRGLSGGAALRGIDPACPPRDLRPGSVVINATSLGLVATDPAPIDLRKLPTGIRVFDMIYRPPRTSLLRQAAEMGLPSANGLSMLVNQGARSLALWTGTSVPIEVMHVAARNALAAE